MSGEENVQDSQARKWAVGPASSFILLLTLTQSSTSKGLILRQSASAARWTGDINWDMQDWKLLSSRMQMVVPAEQLRYDSTQDTARTRSTILFSETVITGYSKILFVFSNTFL